MGGQSFQLGILKLLMFHVKLLDTIYTFRVARSCVGRFIKLAVYYYISPQNIT